MGMRKWAATVFACGILPGCAATDRIEYGHEVPMNAQRSAMVQEAVRAQLKDPYSAMFGSNRVIARVRNGNQEFVICGYVNSKNSFGGYVGMQPYVGVFSVPLNRFDIVAMGGESEYAALHVKGACEAARIPI